MPNVCLSNAKLALLALVIAAGSIACSSSDSGSSSGGSSGGSSSGTTSSSSSSSSSSSGGGGTCTGDVSSCAIGSLSSAQQAEACSLIAAASDDPAGTEYKCDASNLSITTNSKEQCVAQPAKASCKPTVAYLINCQKAAKKDPCSALSENGACSELFFDPNNGCS